MEFTKYRDIFYLTKYDLEFDELMAKFVSNYSSISSLTDPKYLSATGFCFLCQVSFNDRSSFSKHIQTCKVSFDCIQMFKDTPYKCVRCNIYFSRSESSKHLDHLNTR